jgi:hypothetical protein
MSDLAARLALLAEHAPKLRRAGVSSLTIDDITIGLLPPDPPEPQPDEETHEPTGELDDPMTFGRSDGVPGFERPSDLPRKASR